MGAWRRGTCQPNVALQPCSKHESMDPSAFGGGKIKSNAAEARAKFLARKAAAAGGGGAAPAGHTPAKESSGAYNLVAFPTDNRPSSWRASTILQDGVWYNITAVVAPVANATHRGTGVKVRASRMHVCVCVVS